MDVGLPSLHVQYIVRQNGFLWIHNCHDWVWYDGSWRCIEHPPSPPFLPSSSPPPPPPQIMPWLHFAFVFL